MRTKEDSFLNNPAPWREGGRMTEKEAINRAIQIANNQGLRGHKVKVFIIPPSTATGDYMFAVKEISRGSAADGE